LRREEKKLESKKEQERQQFGKSKQCVGLRVAIIINPGPRGQILRKKTSSRKKGDIKLRKKEPVSRKGQREFYSRERIMQAGIAKRVDASIDSRLRKSKRGAFFEVQGVSRKTERKLNREKKIRWGGWGENGRSRNPCRS